MGSSCSSGQAHKDKDNASQRSEESPSYQITCKNDPSGSGSSAVAVAALAGVSGNPVELPSSVPGPSALAPVKASTQAATKTPKPFRNVAPSSYSTDSVSPNSPPAVLSPRDLDKTSLPPLLRKLPAAAQQLLLGWPAVANTAAKARKIVIYVCAADSQDCCVERGVLHNKIYPSLREKAAELGYELHIVDLHWKTGLEKQQDHEFPELCLGELARQSERGYVIPVVFLSHSLGTALLPKTIENQDFEVALSEAADKQLLAKWYQRDAHAQPPCYRLQPPHLHIPGFKDKCAEEKEKALAVWSSEIERILSVMLAAFPQELRDTYLTTVVEQEVHNTVLMSEELARRCLWLCRAETHMGDNSKPIPTPAEIELNRRLEALQAALKMQLREQHMMRVALRWRADETEQAQYAAEVMACLSKQLTSIIDAIIEEHQSKAEIRSIQGIESELLQELNVQSHFTRKTAQCSVNREGVLQQLKSYVMGETGSGQVVVVHGPAGCGKTTLLARTAQCCAVWGPDCAVVARAANISPLSRGLDQLLRTVCLQCALVSTGTQPWLHHNIKSYKEYMPSLLSTASLQRTVIIILDGIDQVEESGCDWLPLPMPPNVKIILSVTDSSPLLQQLKSHLGNGAIFIQIAELAKAEAESILLASVMEYSHSVNSHVHECVRASVHTCTLPLYVKVVAWQTSLWCDAESSFEPQSDVDRQLTAMLSQLEDRLGLEQVSLAVALLTSAKFGLTDSEMLDLLAFTDYFHSSDTYVVWAPACLFWARLTAQLAPFLQWTPVASSVTLQWRSHAVRAAVRQRYLPHLAIAHRTLRDYYKGEMKQQNDERFAAHHIPQTIKYGLSYNCRKLEELPHHEFHSTGSMWKLLEDDRWMFAKICGVSVFQVLEDIRLEEQSGKQNTDIEWLKDFLEKNSRPLAHDGRQFYSLLSKEGSTEGALRTRWHALTSDPPVPSLIPVTGVESGEVGDTLDNQPCIDMIIRLPKNPNYAVTIATEKEEVSVWDVHSCCRVRTLEGITQPIDLQMIDDYRCVVLCKRELCTYDLNTGVLLTKLKGVMNQKMPYFGLHDANHLVALSRNRMYVNLMNLETGDLVTTFKAGEDRFLNSLLVSGDGRVLVCGDETQKPFPLLVWNLASRKLLYDLRIPHHDFITSLAAITYEGHYVCVVAKEVDEPSPNFIVVYDLQSGTLFKKWKPSVNTVSLDISSKDGCVISGLEDGRVLVWDLITGNCRWSLSGHSAPVTCLRLDPSGGGFLSFDAKCRDRSLRLWNLVTGEMSAVLTPRAAITACEVAAGRRQVLLAVQGRPVLAALQLTPAEPPPRPLPPYGLPEHTGRTFTLAAER